MEFESKMMYKVFWIDGTLKEAYFESKEDANNFKTIMFTANPEIEVHINKWSWKVLIEK